MKLGMLHIDVLAIANGGETANPDVNTASRPVAGRGFAGTASHDNTSIQHRPRRMT
jgi:hypothetical protein